MSRFAFLLGAGASQPYGVPTMTGFYASFRDHVKKRRPDLFVLLQRLEKGSEAPSPDLETLLADLQLATSAQAGLKLLGVETKGTLPSEHLADLRGALDAFIVDTCERFDRERSAEDLRALLDARQFGPLWIFTTNYDRLVEHACEQLDVNFSDGFEGGLGRPVADYIGTFTEDVRVVKLHGSVNWFQDFPGGELHRLDRGYSLPTKDFSFVRGGQQLKPLMIIPTLEKLVFDKPYSTLVARLGDVLRECSLLIVIGNSLRDRHLLSQISERMPAMQVLMMSPSASVTLPKLALGECAHALDVGFRELLTTSGRALTQLCSNVHAAETVDSVTESIVRVVSAVNDSEAATASIRANPELASYDAMLSNASVAARARAAEALGAYAHPGVIHRLAGVLQDDLAPAVRAAAAASLIRIGSGEAVMRALAGLKDTAVSVQLEVVTAILPRLKDIDIRKAVDEATPTMKSAAKRVLEHAGTAREGTVA
jgi:hypothetical protein